MNSAETPGKLDPAIDPGLLELDGTTYKDLSHSAAAKRAAYHKAMSAKLLASSSSTTTHEQTSSAASTTAFLHRSDWFENYGTAPDYTAEYGTQGPGQEGYIMHSQAGEGSRLKFNLPFNDGSAPHTYIRAWMRGAPDNGKNSFVCLREQRCADDPSQKVVCDEIDIVEYYGQSSHHRAEFTVYQSGGGQVGTMTWPTPTDPGHDVYSYTAYLEQGNYMKWFFERADGLELGDWDRHVSQGYVPTQPMNLYVGIWDCSGAGGTNNWCSDPPGPFTGDSWMALHGLYMITGA